MENLVVTCPACNFGRDRFTLEEVGLRDPRTHIREPSWDGWRTWVGLEQLLPEPERFFRGLSIAIDPAHDDEIRNVEQVVCPEPGSASAREAEQTDAPENDFFAHLNSKRPDVLDRLKAFVSDVEDNGVRPKVGKTLRLLLSTNSKISATSGMLESNGKFWASGAWAAAKRIGRVQAAEQYLQSLAEITGGSVRRYDKSAPEVLDANGRGIDVLVLLNRAADWKQAITNLARDVSA